MKNIALLFALLGLTSADLTYPAVLPIGQELSFALLREANRNLQSVCDQVEDAAEDILKQVYGFKFSCSCSSGSTYTVTCDSTGEACCGEICGTARQILVFSSSGTPIREEACVTYSSGAGTLDGMTRCATGYYSGNTLSSCDATLGGTACTSCDVCGDLPGTSGMVQYMTVDCANIAGGDLLSAECEDLDTIEELQNLALQCGSASTITLTASILSVVAASFVLLF